MVTLEPPRRWVTAAGAAAGLNADPWAVCGLSRVGLARFVRAAREAVGLRGDVAVLLSGDAAVRRLNRDYRGKDTATDVLSFPAAAEVRAIHAGDLAVSLETARRQAREHGHSLQDEVKVLLLHGMLHLAGMDHEVDRGQMAKRENALRLKLRLKSGLIARVSVVAPEDSRSSACTPASGERSLGTPPSRRMTTRKAKTTTRAKRAGVRV